MRIKHCPTEEDKKKLASQTTQCINILDKSQQPMSCMSDIIARIIIIELL